MAIQTLTVTNFRCFESARFDFSHTLTIIQGSNGSGKTSLLEAIHYSCYLKSFRTHLPLELSREHQVEQREQIAPKSFSIKIVTRNHDTIQVGVADKRRSFKINGVDVKNYNHVMESYKVVTFIEEDLSLLKGYPEQRRTFFDQALSVQVPDYYACLRQARKNIDQRNSLLSSRTAPPEEYSVWVQEFIRINEKIISHRKAYITQIMSAFSAVCAEYGTSTFLALCYKQKRPSVDNEPAVHDIMRDEIAAGRVQYGFHLDDVEFTINNRSSRAFASRGQQKLAVLLLKIAQSRLLMQHLTHSERLVFLLDDFLTDFDALRIEKIVALLFQLNVQMVITIPQRNSFLLEECSKQLRGENMVYITLDPPGISD